MTIIIRQKRKKINKNKKNSEKPLTFRLNRSIIKSSNEGGKRHEQEKAEKK
nr:MAG TPA: hypothetical protein [Caudoviricetes sp.]